MAILQATVQRHLHTNPRHQTAGSDLAQVVALLKGFCFPLGRLSQDIFLGINFLSRAPATTSLLNMADTLTGFCVDNKSTRMGCIFCNRVSGSDGAEVRPVVNSVPSAGQAQA